MDNLTHTLIGATVANAGLKQRWGKGTLLALVLSSNITDIDVFWGFVNKGESFLYRRMFTHSVIGLPVLSILCALLLRRFYKNLPLRTLFGLCVLGTSLHVLFDLMNSYGVVLLYPFSRTRFELGWIFIIDLGVWAMLLVPLFLSLVPPWRKFLLLSSRVAAVGLAMYAGACGLSRWQAGRLLNQWLSSQNQTPSFTYVFPEALGPHRFKGVARLGDTYSVLLLHAWSGRTDVMAAEPTQENTPEVRAILESIPAKNIMWFFKAPVWRRVGASDTWEIYDLRFQSAIFRRRNPFSYRFEFKNGTVNYLE